MSSGVKSQLRMAGEPNKSYALKHLFFHEYGMMMYGMMGKAIDDYRCSQNYMITC